MKEVLSEMHGFLYGRSIKAGMEREDGYGFSESEVKCWVTITEEGVKTEFAVYPKVFCNLEDYLFTTNSFKELREWLEEHKNELK